MTTSDAAPPPSDENLSAAECKLLNAVTTGIVADLRTGDTGLDDPCCGADWGDDRTVRAELLAGLLTGDLPARGGQPRAIKLHGARITGPLDLQARTLLIPLLLQDCHIDQAVNLSEATGPAIRLPGCHLPALTARQLRTTGDVQLGDGFTTRGEVNLEGAHVGGQLNLDSATLENENGLAMTAQGLTVGLDMSCRNGFTAHGEVWLPGAHIGGQLDLTGATMVNDNGRALTADGLTVDQSLYFRGVRMSGEVRLIRGRVGGQLDLTGATLANDNGPALAASNLTVDHDMFCAEGFTARGEVRLVSAHIAGLFDLDGADLSNENGLALTAERLTVGQGMTCRNGFTAIGEVSLYGARIGGNLNLSGAKLDNQQRRALNAAHLTVERHLLCQDGFNARGEVELSGARIGGRLDLAGARLKNTNGLALNAVRLTVGEDMLCQQGFRAHGQVSLHGADIKGLLSFAGAHLANMKDAALNAELLIVGGDMFCRDSTARGQVCLTGAHIGGLLSLNGAHFISKHRPALNADALTVGQDLLCQRGFSAQHEIRLSGARIGGHLDLREATLANPHKVALNLDTTSAAALTMPSLRPHGTVSLINTKVGRFADDPSSWPYTVRLRGFAYDILERDQASVRERLDWLARDDGGYVPQVYDQLAAAYTNAGQPDAARRVAIAKQRRRRHNLNPLNWLWYATVGYGYRTWLAGVWLVALLTAGTWIFSQARMIATVTHPPAFHPFAYTADVTLPIVDLGQKRAWEPQGAALYWSWALTAAGWTLTTAVVAGLTGILKRD